MSMLNKIFVLFLIIAGIFFFFEKFGKEGWFNRIPDKFYKAIIVLIIIVLGAIGLYDSLKYSNELSPIACGPCESEAISSGEVYAKEGFFSYGGLPYISFMAVKNGNPVYTHNPPGVNWLAGFYTKICGPGNFGCFRLFPTTIGIISFFLFARFLLANLSPVKATVMMLAIAFVPMTYNMLHGLHYQSYANSLLLIQLGVLLTIFKKNVRTNKFHIFILFLIGFVQGWLTTEFFFPVSLAALPLALIYSPLKHKEDKKRLVFAILASTIGFGFAHLLHFIQVSVYYGSAMEAYLDIIGKGIRRAGAYNMGYDYSKHHWDGTQGSSFMLSGFTDRYLLLKQYLFQYTRQDIFFGISFKILLLATVLFLIKEANLIIKKPFSIALKWTSSRRYFIVIITAFLIPSLWIIIMYDHSLSHFMFLPRHFFLTYFVFILTMLECVHLNDSDNQKII